MRIKYLAINHKDYKEFKKKEKLVLQHIFFLNKDPINFDNVHDIYLEKKELHNCYKLITKNYFKYLEFLYKKFNILNKTNKSKKFWNIIIGPWLIDYLQSMTRKWFEIKKIPNKKKLYFNYYYFDKITIPEDYLDYDEYIKNENVYSSVYSDILKNYLPQNKKINKSIKIQKNSHRFSKIENFKSIRKLLFSILNSLKINKKNNLVIINTYMGHLREVMLYLKTNTFPYFITNLNFLRNLCLKNSKPVDFNLRNELLKDFKTNNNYENFLKKNFMNFCPKSYIENFDYFENISKDKFLDKTNYIITAVDHFGYDNLKYWIGNQIMKGSKLITIQHGANPGYSLFTQNEFNDKIISDTNFTWGWSDNYKSTKKGFFSFKKINKKNFNKKKILLIIPGNIALQKNIKSNLYFYDNLCFYKIFIPLIKEIYKRYSSDLIVRLPKSRQKEIQLFYRKELNKIDKNIIIDDNELFAKSLEEAKLVITSWDQTVFLQSLNENIPTFAYWSKKSSIVNPTCSKNFLELKRKAVLFDNKNELINTLENNYHNIEIWWMEKKRKKILKKFTDQYCRKGNLVNYIADFCNNKNK